MKSIIKFFSMAAIAAFAMSSARAEDSYLYWLVDSSVHNLISGEAATFDYATVKVSGSDTYLSWYNQGSSTANGWQMYVNDAGGTSAAYWGTFNYTSGSTFLFELWNEVSGGDDTLVGFLETPWVSSSSIASGTDASGATPYVLTGVVPEPTSGLMMLLGLAALALKRRKQA